MPFILHNCRIRINKDLPINTRQEGLSSIDKRPAKVFIGEKYHLFRGEGLKKGTILVAKEIDCLSNRLSCYGRLNETEDFIIGDTVPSSGYLRRIDIEFPDEEGDTKFYNAESLFRKIGKMTKHQFDNLDDLYDNFHPKYLYSFLWQNKCFNESISSCSVGELSQFVYYIIHFIINDMRLKNPLSKDEEEDIIELMKKTASNCLRDKLKYDKNDDEGTLVKDFVYSYDRILFHMILEHLLPDQEKNCLIVL